MSNIRIAEQLIKSGQRSAAEEILMRKAPDLGMRICVNSPGITPAALSHRSAHAYRAIGTRSTTSSSPRAATCSPAQAKTAWC